MRRFSGSGVEGWTQRRRRGEAAAACGRDAGPAYSGGFAVESAVAEHFDVVVGGFDVGVLTADDVAGGGVELVVFEGFAIGGHGGVFTAFGLGEDGVRLVGGEGGLQVDPAAVDAAGDAAGRLDVGAEGEDAGL